MGMLAIIRDFFWPWGQSSREEVRREEFQPRRPPKLPTETDDENLKEIVDAILELHQWLGDLSKKTSSQERTLDAARSQVGVLSRRVDTLVSHLQPKRQAGGDEKFRPQGTSQARANLERKILFAESLLKKCEAMLVFIKKNRKAASDQIDRDCRFFIGKVRAGMKDTDSFGASGPDSYNDLLKTLYSIRFEELVLYLCGLAEDEMKGKPEKDKQETLRAIEELSGSCGLALINPNPGDRCDEHEHQVVSQERSMRLQAGSIAEVVARGFKKTKTGEVLKKARISMVM